MDERLTNQLTGPLREQLQTMTAVIHALGGHLSEDEKAMQYLAQLDKAAYAQLHLILQAELTQRLFSDAELRTVMEPMDLVELGRSVMERTDDLTRPILGIKAEFSSSLAALTTQASRALLEDMLLAFISNSVRAIGQDGAIRLELERQRDQAVFTLTDTGCGLDSEALADLFGPEVEPDDEPEDAPVRGLLLARQIVTLHGGTLVAGNTEAGGARLAVSLPLVERSTGLLRSPTAWKDAGGWNPVLMALGDRLPPSAFLADLSL